MESLVDFFARAYSYENSCTIVGAVYDNLRTMRSVWERSLSQRERVAEGRVRGTRFANIVPLIRPFLFVAAFGRSSRATFSRWEKESPTNTAKLPIDLFPLHCTAHSDRLSFGHNEVLSHSLVNFVSHRATASRAVR